MPDREILCGGDPEPQFERLEIQPACTYDGWWWQGSRLSAWRVTDAQWNRLIADADGPVDHWSPDAWWRYSEGASLGGADAEATFRGRTFVVWDRRDEDDYFGPDDFGDLLTYLCDHVGASTEKNVTACCIELARQNSMGLGEFLSAALGDERRPSAEEVAE